MRYDPKLQAQTEIFEKMRFIDVNQDLYLTPTLEEYLDGEIHMYYKNSSDDSVKKYLPAVYVSSEEDAKDMLLAFVRKTIFRASLFYVIRIKSNKVPIGYIHLNSRFTKSGLNEWSVDFWLNATVKGNNVMTLSLGQMLNYLQQYNVPSMNALVDSTNLASIRVLEKVGFKLKNVEAGGEQRLLYRIRLN